MGMDGGWKSGTLLLSSATALLQLCWAKKEQKWEGEVRTGSFPLGKSGGGKEEDPVPKLEVRWEMELWPQGSSVGIWGRRGSISGDDRDRAELRPRAPPPKRPQH